MLLQILIAKITDQVHQEIQAEFKLFKELLKN
jgi:hypothetical protein